MDRASRYLVAVAIGAVVLAVVLWLSVLGAAWHRARNEAARLAARERARMAAAEKLKAMGQEIQRSAHQAEADRLQWEAGLADRAFRQAMGATRPLTRPATAPTDRATDEPVTPSPFSPDTRDFHPFISPFAAAGLTDEHVRALEQKLESHPDDEHTRALLLTHYGFGRDPGAADAALRHHLWFIRNQPHSMYARMNLWALSAGAGRDRSAEVRQAWLAQVKVHPQDAVVLMNAGDCLSAYDPDAAEELLLRAKKLGPAAEASRLLAGLYQSQMESTSGEARRDVAAKALREWDAVLSATEADPGRDRWSRPELLSAAGAAAVEAGETEKVRRYAISLLEWSRQPLAPEESAEEELGPGPKQQTVAAHRAQVLLGRAALRSGDIEEAKQHLLASATVGPLFADMTLARELLSRGERETVRDYLRHLARADGADTADLNLLGSWLETIDGGGTPDFDQGAPIARKALLPR